MDFCESYPGVLGQGQGDSGASAGRVTAAMIGTLSPERESNETQLDCSPEAV